MRSLISALLVFVLTAVAAPASDFPICKQRVTSTHSTRILVRAQAPLLPDIDLPVQVVFPEPLYPVGLIDFSIEPAGIIPVLRPSEPARAPPQFSSFS